VGQLFFNFSVGPLLAGHRAKAKSQTLFKNGYIS